jgi:two-component system phosphate regulon sensor histidine kinase PhoR
MIIAMFMILKQKRLSEIQKDFINNMTHEFKTPLSSILASVETIRFALVQEDHLSDRVSRYLGIIHTEGKRLQNQVEAVLKMANFETTRLNKREIILEDLLKHNIDAVEAQVQALGGEIRFTAPGNSLLDADALHLSNVFSNLIDNAIKYNASKPQIEIRVQRQPRGRVQVTVSDNGIGIAREQLARIFDKFYRVPTGNVHNVKGFGLGLHYVKSVVKAHGGRVFAQSVPGQGTSITLEFRLKPPGVIKK